MAELPPAVEAGATIARRGSWMSKRSAVGATPLTTRVARGPVLISAAMVAAGVGLLWPVPQAGALLIVAGGVGLATSGEPVVVEVVGGDAPIAPFRS